LIIHDLPPSFLLTEGKTQKEKGGMIKLPKMVEKLEKEWILAKLKESDWNQEKAAGLLGVTRKMLRNRMAKYKLESMKSRRARH